MRDYDPKKWNTDGHIQAERSALNVVLTHNDLKSFFEKTFGNAIELYNEKNKTKHPDRIMSVNDYYNKYKNNAQECIIQMGNHENYMELVSLVGQEQADEIHKDFLTKSYEQWLTENPSLRIFSAAIHMDETKEGTPHIHIDYLPVAESSRGLSVKVSMDGAMKQLGFSRKTKSKDGENDKYAETPFKRWLAHQRVSIEQLAANYINIMPSEPYSKQKRQETWQWRAEQKKHLEEEVAQLTEDKLSLTTSPKKHLTESRQAFNDRRNTKQQAAAVLLRTQENEKLNSELNKRAAELEKKEKILNDMQENIQQHIESSARALYQDWRHNTEETANNILKNARNKANKLIKQAKNKYYEYISDFIEQQKPVIQQTLQDVEAANSEMTDYFKENLLADGRNALRAFEQDYQKKQQQQLYSNLRKENPPQSEPETPEEQQDRIIAQMSQIEKLYTKRIYDVGQLVRNKTKLTQKYNKELPYSVDNDLEVYYLAMQLQIIKRDNIKSINGLKSMIKDIEAEYADLQQQLADFDHKEQQFKLIINNAEQYFSLKNKPENQLTQSEKLTLQTSEGIMVQCKIKSYSEIERVRQLYSKNAAETEAAKKRIETLKQRQTEYTGIVKKYTEITQSDYISQLTEKKRLHDLQKKKHKTI